MGAKLRRSKGGVKGKDYKEDDYGQMDLYRRNKLRINSLTNRRKRLRRRRRQRRRRI